MAAAAAAAGYRQFQLLLWKDYLIRKRKLITLGGILWATLVSLSLYVVRVNIDNQDYQTCQFPARALPSAGMLNFLQSFICSVNNPCTPFDQYQEIPSYESSRLTQLQRKFTPLLYNESILEVAAAVPDALRLLGTLAVAADEPTFLEVVKNGLRVKDLFQNPRNVKRNILMTKLNMSSDVAEAVMQAEISFQSVLKGNLDRCDSTSLSETILVEESVAKVLVDRICPMTSAELQDILIATLLHIDYSKYVQMIGNMYYKLNGDKRIVELSYTLKAMLRITKLDSFIPPELVSIFNAGDNVEQFRYFNLTIISKLMDLFEPTFGETESYKSIRGITDTAVPGLQWIYKLLSKQEISEPVNKVTGLVLQSVDDHLKLGDDEKISSLIAKAIDKLARNIDGGVSVDAVFDILPKITNFILRWIPKETKHDVLFYSTLLAKLIEGARKVVVDNMNVEQIVYNASLRHPDGVKIMTALPIHIVAKAFDGLSDADRTMLLTAKLTAPKQMFCDDSILENFFQISKQEVTLVKKYLCTDEWISYVSDLIRSFGIFDVKNNINSMASLLIQETLGKDTSDQLYPIDKGFLVLKDFVKSVLNLHDTPDVIIDWNTVLGVNDDSEFMKMLRDKQHLSAQVLITVHGALTKEIVKQNTILDIKITPIFIDITTLITAMNDQLKLSDRDAVLGFKRVYPDVLLTMLTTLLNEDKTFGLLSNDNIEIFCDGVDDASRYMDFYPDVDAERLVTALCNMSKAIEDGLRNDSLITKALNKIKISKSSEYGSVEWTKLINKLKDLYVTLRSDYTYLFEFASYGMGQDTRRKVDQLMIETKNYWFSKETVSRTVHLSISVIFRGLDLVDAGVFSVTSDVWRKVKYSFATARRLLMICDDVVKFITAITTNESQFHSDLPPLTIIALKMVLPNMPRLVIDTANLIVNDDSDVQKISALMNSEPGWPCSDTSLSELLALTSRSKQAVLGLESIFCMNQTLQQEWLHYQHVESVRMLVSLDNLNTTVYEPHLFLKFSQNFDALIKDATKLKTVLDQVFNDNSTEVQIENPTFIAAWKYAIDALNRTDSEDVFRRFFTKVDSVLDAINTTTSLDTSPLNNIWESYIKCLKTSSGDECKDIPRVTWKYTLKFLSVVTKSVADDLLTYFKEVNEPNANIIQSIGFTKKTGLYILYEKLADFVGVLLNSYWDYGFMNQIRRASKSQFWDCEALVEAMVIPPGSLITAEDIRKVRPFVCPSFLYWVSLPRGENSLLDVVSKPQYYFYTLLVQNLTSDYKEAFDKYVNLTNQLAEISSKTDTKILTEEDLQITSIENKVNNFVDNVLTWKLNDTDPSYRLFNEINKKQFLSSSYLTRVIAIINRMQTVFDKIKIKHIAVDKDEDEIKKLEADLLVIQKKFKRRPAEILALNFDIITDVLWNNKENYSLTNSIESMCENLNNRTVKTILADDKRFLTQVCSKNYNFIFGAAQNILVYDLQKARMTLQNLVEMLHRPEDKNVTDIFQFFNDRKELVNSLKQSIKYSDDLNLPIYLKYLQNNLKQYDIVLSFLAGEDWWSDLRALYNGSITSTFFDTIENSVEIVENVLTHLDQIHLVRLLRDINFNDTSSLCQPNVTVYDYIPDKDERLSSLKQQVCEVDQSLLYQQLPIMLIVSQGYDNRLTISKEIDYTALYYDIENTETKLRAIRNGPQSPTRPQWITDVKLGLLRTVFRRLFTKETMTKISFGVLSNIVDASTLFLDNSKCVFCSRLTTWFKQLNLQMFKKQDYDNLLCHLGDMTLQDVYHTLKNDFHWDMALKEIISPRNYTNLELNKAVNEFLEQTKLHLLDDVTSTSNKLAECLASNVSNNAFGNASLFFSVLSHSLKLLRAELPHLQEIDGMKKVAFIKQMHADVAHRLNIEKPLRDIVKDKDVYQKIQETVKDKELVNKIKGSSVNLYKLKNNPDDIKEWVKLSNTEWEKSCDVHNCSRLTDIIYSAINREWIDSKLSTLQSEEFWRLEFISEVIDHVERSLLHVSRLLGVASRLELVEVYRGRLSAVLDMVLQIMQEDTLQTILFSLKGFVEELHVLVNDTPLDFDLEALLTGLRIVGEYRHHIVTNMDLKLKVSELFSDAERVESGLSRLGINNTNFWSLAAPRLHDGYIDLKPLLTRNVAEYRIKSFVCVVEEMSSVLVPAIRDVVTLEDALGAVQEQFCALTDERAKSLLPVLLQNLNFGFVIDKVTKLILSEVYKASKLTEEEGATVLSKYKDMISLIPLVQENIGGLAESFEKEPVFEALKDFHSVGGLLSSSSFLSSAGNMLCGKPFVGNGNRFYKAIAETKDFMNEPDPAQLEVLPTDFCRSLYKDILGMGGGKIVWSFVKPLIMGKILYTPPTPAVHKIIEKANSSFAFASRLAGMVHKFSDSFASVEVMTEHRRGVNALRTLSATDLFKEITGSAGTGNVSVDGLLDDLGDMKGIGSLLTKASDLLHCINLNRFHSMPDEQMLTHEAVKLTRINEFSAGLVFMNINEKEDRPLNVEYKIRMDIESVPTTSRIRNQFWTPGPEGNFLEDMRYFRGFIQIQDLVDRAIIQLSQNHTSTRRKRDVKNDMEYGVYTQQLPYPCYRRDYFQSSLYESQALIVAFFVSLLYSVCSAIRFIVAEKESGNTMLMSVMGVNLTNHTLSWFVASFAEVVATCACVGAVLCAGGVLPRTSPSLLFALMVNFGFSVLMFCYMVSKLFRSASLAAVCGGLGYLVTFMPFVIILALEAVLPDAAKLLTSLSMSTAFCYSLLHVTRYEAAGRGAGWRDVTTAPDHADHVTIAVTALMVFLDGLLYLAVGCLLDRFFGFKTLKSNINKCTTKSEKSGVSIVNISKVYGEGGRRARLALDNVSLELQKGQITTLLGHNGAGKTTLIKIITGMLKPTKGHVVMRSHADDADDADDAGCTRLGVCPQQDVLFESLTAAEHLSLYAQLKSGLTADQVQSEVDSMIAVLSFTSVCARQVRCLSGGLRRRLCVALAFVARPQLVLLDEPSSGVDPVHRRDIWSLIVKLKEDRAVLLTTHHLDEAELLSDQLVIMHKGQIHTIGSPIEIKRSLGNGYSLTVVYPERESAEDTECIEELTKSLLTAVKEVVRNAQLVDVNGLEVEINLPFFDANGLNNDFLKLCTRLEAGQSALGFRRYYLECSSLEQVLYNICTQTDPQPPYAHAALADEDVRTQSASSSSIKADKTPLVPSEGPLRGTNWEQFRALLYKRYIHYTRNWWLLFLLLVLPSLFVTVAMAFSMIRPPPDNEIALRLTPDLYQNSTQFFMPKPTVYSADLDPGFAESIMRIIEHSGEYQNWTEKDSPTCRCTEVRQECAYEGEPPRLPELMALPDIRTVNDWLIATQETYIQKRYGGFTSALKNNRTHLVVWYNNKGHHAMPSFLNALNSAILRRVADNPAASIAAYTHPLKISHEQLSKSTLLQHVADVGISGMVLLAYSLVPAGGAIYLVLERTSQQKRLQLLCAVTPRLYWAAALLWDLLIISLNIALTCCVVSAFGFPVFVHRDNLPAVCLLLLLYGWSCSSLVHVLEKLFTDPSVANMVLFCGNAFAGLSGLAVLLILDIISDSEATDNARWTLHKIFLLSPQFALGDALLEIAKNTVQAQVLSRFGMETYASPLRTALVAPHYAALALLGAALAAFNLALEYDCFQALRRSRLPPDVTEEEEMEESDVAAERRRVESQVNAERPVTLHTIGNINAGFIPDKCSPVGVRAGAGQDVVQCVSLWRRYPGRGRERGRGRGQDGVALRRLTLGVPPGQCTALLGENGAGKSTTFSVLSGEQRACSGHVYLLGRRAAAADLCSGVISYCPQSDALDPLLTVRQTLDFYCQLRGIADKKEVIDRALVAFSLRRYGDVRTRALSGGNKRKLCAVLAFMSRARLVLLDEPTSGMDPGSRACVWRACACACAAWRAVLLSTHALHDAARLASRLAVLRAGRLAALAPRHRCLDRFGGGCVVSMRLRRRGEAAGEAAGEEDEAGGEEVDATRTWRALQRRAPHAVLRALHAAALQAFVPYVATVNEKEVHTSQSDVFRLMAELQVGCDVDDFTVNQSSLDEMFLNFTDKKDENIDVFIEPLPSPSPLALRRPGEQLDSVTSL